MPTPNESYWNSISLSETDVERLYGCVLEEGEPVATQDLVKQTIDARIREEEERRARFTAEAKVYQPKLEFEVGQRLVFSTLREAEGIVTGIRPSDNPRLPPFQVITVSFGPEHSPREFAAGYTAEHPLNRDLEVAAATADLTPQQIYDAYGEAIQSQLVARLRADKEFVEERGRWLLRGLLVDVHEGYLNLAEAAVEQANAALSTPELAQVLEIAAPKKSTLYFSLDYALQHDARFENVGPQGEPRWFLTRLIPTEARETPQVLQRPAIAAMRLPLPPELETLVEELGDTADVNAFASANAPTTLPIITVELTYPHRRAGTLPLTASVRSIFPETDNPRMLVTLMDALSSSRIQGWFVREGNYLAGLKAYYDRGKLNPGAHLQLQRRPENLTASVEYVPQRERSLWVRVARVQGGQFTFAQEKRPVAHKYDEEMLIVIGDQAGIDQLHQTGLVERPLEDLLAQLFPELAKLTGGGRVHAKTLFSAVNFLRRAGPRAVFTALMQSAAFSSVGGGYFVMETARDFAR